MPNTEMNGRAKSEAALTEFGIKLAGMVKDAQLDGNPTTGELEHESGQLLNPAVMLMFDTLNVLMTDAEPSEPTPIFIHVRADWELVVKTVADLYSRGKVSVVYLGGSEGEKRGGTEPGVIFQGYTFWRTELTRCGVPAGMIYPTGPVYNTPDEHAEMIKFGKELGWERIQVIGNPYQMLRIGLGSLRFMMQEDFWMKCHFVIPKVPSWSVEVDGPQGTKDGARFNQMYLEFIRVIEYMAKSPRDLRTLSELIQYITVSRESIQNNKLTLPLS